MERERSAGPAFHLATERWVREIEALPAEPRMVVDRILVTAERELEHADQQRARAEGWKRQGLIQAIHSGNLAPQLTPPWAVKGRRPTGEELDRQVEYALREHNSRARQRDIARIGARAVERVDAVLAMNRGRSETAEQRLKKMPRREGPQMGDPGYAQWREQQRGRSGRER